LSAVHLVVIYSVGLTAKVWPPCSQTEKCYSRWSTSRPSAYLHHLLVTKDANEKYNIAGFNVPLETLQIISETILTILQARCQQCHRLVLMDNADVKMSNGKL